MSRCFVTIATTVFLAGFLGFFVAGYFVVSSNMNKDSDKELFAIVAIELWMKQ